MSFYDHGLRFECIQCSRCCRHEPGFVFLSEQDIGRLISALGLDRDAFLRRYCLDISTSHGRRLSLREKPNRDCVLWENDGCSVYGARPLQCSSYPFWPAHLLSRTVWDALGAACPGINQGELHSPTDIEKWVRLREREPLILLS